MEIQTRCSAWYKATEIIENWKHEKYLILWNPGKFGDGLCLLKKDASVDEVHDALIWYHGVYEFSEEECKACVSCVWSKGCECSY